MLLSVCVARGKLYLGKVCRDQVGNNYRITLGISNCGTGLEDRTGPVQVPQLLATRPH